MAKPAPTVARFDRVKVDEGPFAQLILRILQTQSPQLRAGDALGRFAEELGLHPWTPYRWLLGRKPSPALRKMVERFARDIGLPTESHPS